MYSLKIIAKNLAAAFPAAALFCRDSLVPALWYLGYSF